MRPRGIDATSKQPHDPSLGVDRASATRRQLDLRPVFNAGREPRTKWPSTLMPSTLSTREATCEALSTPVASRLYAANYRRLDRCALDSGHDRRVGRDSSCYDQKLRRHGNLRVVTAPTARGEPARGRHSARFSRCAPQIETPGRVRPLPVFRPAAPDERTAQNDILLSSFGPPKCGRGPQRRTAVCGPARPPTRGAGVRGVPS